MQYLILIYKISVHLSPEVFFKSFIRNYEYFTGTFHQESYISNQKSPGIMYLLTEIANITWNHDTFH